MPSRSEKQRRFLHAKFGHAWVKRHHYNVVKPKRRKAKKTTRKRRSGR